MNVFRKKLPAADEINGLRRVLSASDLTFLGIGNMIGTGIFVLTGVAAATQAGPAIILSFIVAGIACAFVAFAYAELAASVGGAGATATTKSAAGRHRKPGARRWKTARCTHRQAQTHR